MTADTPNTRPLDSRADYATALGELCTLAEHALYVFDKNFDGLDFNSAARHDQLRQFLLADPANRLYLLVQDEDYLRHHCPRLLNLLQHFSGSMFLYRLPKHLQHIATPFAVADARHCVRRFHFDHPQGVFEAYDTENGNRYQNYFMDLWNASKTVANVTGLRL